MFGVELLLVSAWLIWFGFVSLICFDDCFCYCLDYEFSVEFIVLV